MTTRLTVEPASDLDDPAVLERDIGIGDRRLGPVEHATTCQDDSHALPFDDHGGPYRVRTDPHGSLSRAPGRELRERGSWRRSGEVGGYFE